MDDFGEGSLRRAPGGRMHRLLIYDNAGNMASSHNLGREALTIGREPSCELPLADINISRKHARIEPIGRFYVIRDLKSTNGTWVNQNPVKMHLLKHGDVIRIGNFRLVVQAPGDASPHAGDIDPAREDCHTKIIDAAFAYDGAPESRHTFRLNVGEQSAQYPSDRE